MAFDPHMEPLHDGTDKELIDKLARECSGEREITLKALAALGWQQNYHRGIWYKPDGTTDPPAITWDVIDNFARPDDLITLTKVMHDMGWKREARIIRRACEDLPAFIQVANAMSRS